MYLGGGDKQIVYLVCSAGCPLSNFKCALFVIAIWGHCRLAMGGTGKCKVLGLSPFQHLWACNFIFLILYSYVFFIILHSLYEKSDCSYWPRTEQWLWRSYNCLNALDKCTVCEGANLISMVWNFKGITCCNCLTGESINHCSVRSSCNFVPNAGIYFPSILSFFSFNLVGSFERLIAAIFKNNKLVSHMFWH